MQIKGNFDLTVVSLEVIIPTTLKEIGWPRISFKTRPVLVYFSDVWLLELVKHATDWKQGYRSLRHELKWRKWMKRSMNITERQFWHKVQSMVLMMFICPSHITNWSLGLLESMGHDRHPIRTLVSFHYQKYLHIINKCHSIWKWATRKTRFRHHSCIGVYGKYLQVYKSQAERLKGGPYIWVCFQASETLECLCLIQDYCQTKGWILTSFWPNRARGMNTNKRNRYKLTILVCIEWSMHKERILRRSNWSILCEG